MPDQSLTLVNSIRGCGPGVQSTIGNVVWLGANEEKVRALFPAEWTHFPDLNTLKLRYGMKLIGIDYRSEQELNTILVFLTQIGIVQVHTEWIRCNPERIPRAKL